MFKVFKKKIHPLHSFREYDNLFSSKNDVLSPENTPKFPSKNALPDTVIINNNNKNNDHKNTAGGSLKNSNYLPERQEPHTIDELENSFRKRHAEFYYHKKTFIFCKRSFYLFDENNKIRKFAVWLTESFLFEFITLLIIILNAVLLGLRDYRDEDNIKRANEIYQYLDPIFILYYAAETILKIIARGLYSESNSYLRTGWNWIDLFVVISGILYFEESLHYYSILRIGRVIQFLKSFKTFKSINDMVRVILKSFWPLIAILGVLVFFMGIFSILGLNIYNGELDFRCRMTPVPENGVWQTDTSIVKICGSGYKCPVDLYCGSSYEFSDFIHDPSEDIFMKEFNWGLSNFDNIFEAFFTVFMIINGNWFNLVQMMSDAERNVIAILFCFFTYIVCKFFILQLAVAVMLENYTKIKKKENPKKFLINPNIGKIEELEDKSEMSLEVSILFINFSKFNREA